jgi:outer membrane murein-binding lipoprotein Lpp
VSLEEQLRNDAQSLREVGWFNRAIMMDAAANEIKKLNDRITQLERENDALRADLLLWNEKECK